MHILFLTTEYFMPEGRNCGGLGVYVCKTAAALYKKGHHVSVLWLSTRNAQWLDDGVEICEIASMASYIPQLNWRLESLWNFTVFFLDRLRLRRKARLALRRGVQVIHAAGLHAPAYFFPSSWPVVTRLSSLQHLLLAASGAVPNFFSRFLVKAERRQLVSSLAAFAPSRFIAGQAEQFSNKPVHVIPTLPDSRPVNPSTAFYDRALKGKHYLLYFGQMSRIKGTDILAHALPRILREFPDVHVALIGRDDGLPDGISCENYLLSCLNLADRQRIIFSPPLSHGELEPCIQNALCVLQPSRVDNLPNTCIEALSLKKVVIGTTPTSIEELVQDGVNGFLVPKENAEALAQKVIDYLSGKLSLSRLGLLFTGSQNFLSQLEQLYRSVIDII